MIIFEVISPITLPSLSSAAISRRSRAKKASCTSFGSAATPGDTAVAENDRIDWSRPPSSTIGSVGVNSRISRKPASSAASFNAAPLGQLNGAIIKSASSALTVARRAGKRQISDCVRSVPTPRLPRVRLASGRDASLAAQLAYRGKTVAPADKARRRMCHSGLPRVRLAIPDIQSGRHLRPPVWLGQCPASAMLYRLQRRGPENRVLPQRGVQLFQVPWQRREQLPRVED